MQRLAIAGILLVCALGVTGCVSGHYAYRVRDRIPEADSGKVMTNEDIIALSKARIGDHVIISLMERSGSRFRLSTPDVIALADSGVSDKVISAMLKSDATPDSTQTPGGYVYYPWYHWYAGYPFWYPWDPWFYGGFSAAYYRPLYGRWWYAPRYAAPYGRAYAPRYGPSRSPGRRR